ncbi:MAG: hypothetical protein ACI8S6_002681 [Myxococcota bacterium]|jgi:hypothetical protein
MKNNPWLRRSIIAGLLIAPSLAFAAVEMSDSDSSLCSMVSSLFSCNKAEKAPCAYSGN